jgi:type II secretory pathway pseudopilin PulG
MKPSKRNQRGHSLVQSLLGLMLSMLVLMAAFAAFAWVQSSHRQLQTQVEVQQRLRTALQLLRLRVQRAGAPGLAVDGTGKFKYDSLSNALMGTTNSLSLAHWANLTPADCQGHESSYLSTIEDYFSISKQALVCKDTAPEDSMTQALFEGMDGLSLLYAQALPGPALQWRTADKVTLWSAVRGVQICLQAKTVGVQVPSSASCISSLNAPGLSWRGVAVFKHAAP